MSDFNFNDFLNDHQGLMGLAGMQQRGTMLRNQRAQLDAQAAQARQMEAHSREMEAHAREMQESAKRTEDIERERLKIEKERIRLQQNQDELNKLKAQELREMRKFLTSMGGSLASLRKEFSTKKPRPCEEDMTLTIQLATLEAAAAFMLEWDMFEEIADMQVFAQFRADLDSLVSESFNVGCAKKHPLEFVRTTIFHYRNELDKMREYYSALFLPAEILKTEELYTLTESEINTIYSESKQMLDGLASGFEEFLQNLRRPDSQIDVNLYSEEIEALSKIPDSSPNSNYLAILWENEALRQGTFVECAKAQGAKFKEITASLEWAISMCEAWPAAMQDALSKVEEVRRQADAGNYLSAIRFYEICPRNVAGVDYVALEKSLEKSIVKEVRREADAGNYLSAKHLYENCPRKVAGFDYKALEKSILRWEKQLNEAQKVYETVKLGYSFKIKTTEGVARISLTKRCEEEFSPLISKLVAFEEDANSLPECEYKNEASKFLGEVNDKLRELRQRAAKIEASAKTATILYAIIGAVVILFIILLLKPSTKPSANPTGDSATLENSGTSK